MSVFIIIWVSSIVFAVISIICFIIAFFLEEAKYSVIAGLASAIVSFILLFNIDVSEMLNGVFRLNRQAEEHVYMIALNTKGKPLGIFEISHGTVNLSICNPRDIFIKALLCGAYGIILAHNHPSGDTTPSKDDMEVYKRIKEAGKIIGVYCDMGDFITDVENGKKPVIKNSPVVPLKAEDFREILSKCWDMAQNGEDKFNGINNLIGLAEKCMV